MRRFQPLLLGPLYAGISRGLTADILAADALGGFPHAVCTAHVVASHGTVTDVLPVPTDTIAAQLEHLMTALPEEERPTAAKLSLLPHPRTVDAVFQALSQTDVPTFIDCTLSGPSGEDIIESDSVEALRDRFPDADLVSVRAVDAELLVQMEIRSLDDAQVAVQRMAQVGARRVLLRCGNLPARHFDEDGERSEFNADLYYDGSEFALFETPHQPAAARVHGASSGLLLHLLRHWTDEEGEIPAAIQEATRFSADAIRAAVAEEERSPVFH